MNDDGPLQKKVDWSIRIVSNPGSDELRRTGGKWSIFDYTSSTFYMTHHSKINIMCVTADDTTHIERCGHHTGTKA